MPLPRIAIHGHFYQPPRENPWTGLVERQPSAAPDHDWNIRIARECYLPNLNRGNLSRLSFNFGPTLLSWADTALPELAAGVVANDRAAIARGRRGPAMAQLFSHPIAPLLHDRDLRTQIQWGILDFERRFGRRPEGMWLPECAVDTRSLQALADAGITFTILSAAQVKRMEGASGKMEPAGDPAAVSSTPALARLAGGKTIQLYFYDLGVSQSISFGETLTSPARLVDVLKRAALARGDGGLVIVATDGETFGHHKYGGDAALEGALHALSQDADVELVTIADLAATTKPARRVELHEPSAWSCAHGVGRWSRDCGCRSHGGHQMWRAPLREAMEQLTVRIHDIFERAGAEVFTDPWEARDRMAGAPPAVVAAAPWLPELLRNPDHTASRRRALRLLEMERQLLFAHTSCGWFFDDIGGIEPVQNLRCAARAIELSHGGAPVEDEFIRILRRAPSNDARLGDGAGIYKRFALASELDHYGIAARAALSWLHGGVASEFHVAENRITPGNFRREMQQSRIFASGVARVVDAFDGPDEWISFAALALADGESFVYLAPGANTDRAAHAANVAHAAFATGRLPECLRVLSQYYPSRVVHQQDLSPDERDALQTRSTAPPATAQS